MLTHAHGRFHRGERETEVMPSREDVVEEVEFDLIGEVAVVHRAVDFASLALLDEALALWSLEELIELVGVGEQAALAFASDVEDRAGYLVFKALQVEFPEVVEVVAYWAVQHPEALAYVAQEQAGHR